MYNAISIPVFMLYNISHSSSVCTSPTTGFGPLDNKTLLKSTCQWLYFMWMLGKIGLHPQKSWPTSTNGPQRASWPDALSGLAETHRDRKGLQRIMRAAELIIGNKLTALQTTITQHTDRLPDCQEADSASQPSFQYTIVTDILCTWQINVNLNLSQWSNTVLVSNMRITKKISKSTQRGCSKIFKAEISATVRQGSGFTQVKRMARFHMILC